MVPPAATCQATFPLVDLSIVTLLVELKLFAKFSDEKLVEVAPAESTVVGGAEFGVPCATKLRMLKADTPPDPTPDVLVVTSYQLVLTKDAPALELFH